MCHSLLHSVFSVKISQIGLKTTAENWHKHRLCPLKRRWEAGLKILRFPTKWLGVLLGLFCISRVKSTCSSPAIFEGLCCWIPWGRDVVAHKTGGTRWWHCYSLLPTVNPPPPLSFFLCNVGLAFLLLITVFSMIMESFVFLRTYDAGTKLL